MANIIQVDFKKKEITKNYKQYQWVNALTGEMILQAEPIGKQSFLNCIAAT